MIKFELVIGRIVTEAFYFVLKPLLSELIKHFIYRKII